MVKFDAFTEEDAKKTPEEIFGNILTNEVVDIKSAPYDDKIRFVKYCMAYDGLINASILTNISFLVFGRNISDDVFADEHIIFANLEEYVDAKYDLKPEIEKYGREILKFYLASIKSYAVILPDGKIDIPASYLAILMSSNITDMSKLMGRYTIDTKDLPLVYRADEVIDTFRLDSPVIKDFVDNVIKTLKEKQS